MTPEHLKVLVEEAEGTAFTRRLMINLNSLYQFGCIDDDEKDFVESLSDVITYLNIKSDIEE